MRLLRLTALIVAGALLVSSQNVPPARSTYSTLQREVASAYKAKQYLACRDALIKVSEFTHGGSRVTLNLARASALAGKTEDAFGYLNRYFEMGLFLDSINKDEDLQSLHKDARWAKIVGANQRNTRGLSSSKTIHTVQDPALLTEDIAWDPRTESYFLTSVRTKKVYRVREDGTETVFADLSRDPGWPLFAVVVDVKRRVLWVTAAAMPRFAISPEEDAGRSALLKFDLDTGKYLRRFDLPQERDIPRVFGDAALTPSGDLIISDGRSGGVFRFHDGTFHQIDNNEFVSPQTPAVTPDGRFVFVADYARGLARIDLRSGDVHWLNHPDTVSLDGIDGLYLDGRSLYAIQNGVNPPRVVRLLLNAGYSAVDSAEILESNTYGLGEPTHGVLTRHGFVFIANAGWDQLTEDGRVRAEVRPTPPSLRLIKLTH